MTGKNQEEVKKGGHVAGQPTLQEVFERRTGIPGKRPVFVPDADSPLNDPYGKPAGYGADGQPYYTKGGMPEDHLADDKPSAGFRPPAPNYGNKVNPFANRPMGVHLDEPEKKAILTDLNAHNDFNNTNLNIDLSGERGTAFTGGDFKISNNMYNGMVAVGQDLLDIAKGKGTRLEDSKEFAGADFNKDGKIDAREAGAVALAASLEVTTNGFAPGNTASFDNDFSKSDAARLLDPKSKAAVMEIARQLLGDNNGVKVAGADTNTPSSNAQAVQAVNNMKPDVTARC